MIKTNQQGSFESNQGGTASLPFNQKKHGRMPWLLVGSRMKNEKNEPQFFSQWGDPEVRRGKLPHWEVMGATYFVTWRQADAIPAEAVEEMREKRECWLNEKKLPLREQDEADLHRLFSNKIDEWMDAGKGSCLLRRPEFRNVVDGSLRYFDHERYLLHSFVIMPNHVHVLFSHDAESDSDLASIVHSWKSFSASQINRQAGRTGEVLWQKEYFDRLIRDWSHFGNCVRYIRRNPEKAGLNEGEFTLYEGEWAASI